MLNSFLQFVEADDSDSLILAATNQLEVLDPALFRRFDDVIRYGLPTADAAEELIRNVLNVFTINGDDWAEVRRACDGLSYAEIARACTEAATSCWFGWLPNLDLHPLVIRAGCFSERSPNVNGPGTRPWIRSEWARKGDASGGQLSTGQET